MYEFSLTQTLNNAIQRLCFSFGWRKVRRIMIKVGGMRKVNPELMAFIFAALSKDTPAEGALLSVMIMPVTLHCHSCGRKGYREDTEFMCPSCGSRNIEILTGLEIATIEALEVEGSPFNNE